MHSFTRSSVHKITLCVLLIDIFNQNLKLKMGEINKLYGYISLKDVELLIL